jgi:hypothetical protein
MGVSKGGEAQLSPFGRPNELASRGTKSNRENTPELAQRCFVFSGFPISSILYGMFKLVNLLKFYVNPKLKCPLDFQSENVPLLAKRVFK